MNAGTVIVLIIVASAAGLAIRSMMRDKKNGKSLQCGGDCSHCGGHCLAERSNSTDGK